jgi:hypothetical protein
MATLSNGVNAESRSLNGLSNGHPEANNSSQQVLVIGSLGSAKDSTYYSVLASLQGNINKYMIDRIVEGGMCYSGSALFIYFAVIDVLLSCGIAA